MRRSIGLKITAVVLAVVVLIAAAHWTQDRVFYNPNRDFSGASSTFSILSQLLSPTVTASYLESRDPGSVSLFGAHQNQFRLLQFSYARDPDEPQNTGTFAFHFGNAQIKDYSDALSLGDLTCRQELFLSPAQKSDTSTVQADKSYLVWVRLDQPADAAAFTADYGWLLDNAVARDKGCGIFWIPVQTSDRPEDICLGMAGNLSFHYLHTDVFAGEDFYDMDLMGREDIFQRSLSYLNGHPKDTEAFLQTGLWEGAQSVDFEQRLSYITENGVKYLGFVGLLPGSELQTLQTAPLSILKIQESA